jgi:hypothetical protein
MQNGRRRLRGNCDSNDLAAEGWSRDITEDIAREIVERAALRAEP